MKTKKLVNRWLRIVIIICVLVGAVRIEAASCKVVSTAYHLTTIWCSDASYNTAVLVDDEMLEKHWQNEREAETYYNSSDTIIRTYSHLPFGFKWITFFFALLFIVSIPIAFIAMFSWRYWMKEKYRRQLARKEREERLAKKEAQRAKELLELLI